MCFAELLLGGCTLITTVCVSLLVYNNLCYTKKIARETAEEAIKKAFKNVKQLKAEQPQAFALELYNMAIAASDYYIKELYLEEAEKECGENDKDLKERIERLKEVIKKVKEYNRVLL